MRRAAALTDSWELVRVSCVIVAIYPLLGNSPVLITILLDLRRMTTGVSDMPGFNLGGSGRDIIIMMILHKDSGIEHLQEAVLA